MHFSWSVFTFAFNFLLFCLLQWMVGPQQISFGQDTLRFSLPRTL
jgi:hypothetical protein